MHGHGARERGSMASRGRLSHACNCAYGKYEMALVDSPHVRPIARILIWPSAAAVLPLLNHAGQLKKVTAALLPSKNSRSVRVRAHLSPSLYVCCAVTLWAVG